MTALDIVRAGSAVGCRPCDRYVLDDPGWSALVAQLPEAPDLELTAMWAEPAQIHTLFRNGAAGAPLVASVPVTAGSFLALSPARPAAPWFERMIRDLWGHRAEGAVDLRPWLDHGAWPITAPLSAAPAANPHLPQPPEFASDVDLPPGATRLGLGPVRADAAEAGHLRLSIRGEAVLGLEARLGYAHRGVLRLMLGKTPRTAARFVARLAGDATVAHAVAFARAAEAAAGTDAPPRADYLRGVMAEIELVTGHLARLRLLAGVTGLSGIAARLAAHENDFRSAAEQAFGHRLLMDAVIPGGVAADLAPPGAAAILGAVEKLAPALPSLQAAGGFLPGLLERLQGLAIVSPAVAARYASGGYVGRASGRAGDLRREPGYPPYGAIAPDVPVRTAGDASARAQVCVAELVECLRLLRLLLAAVPEGPAAVQLPMASGEGLGWAEAGRGDVWHWLRLDGGLIGAAFARDPAWLHWPLLEAVASGPEALATLPVLLASFGTACAAMDL